MSEEKDPEPGAATPELVNGRAPLEALQWWAGSGQWLSAGLREVERACERGDAPGPVRAVAARALSDVDRLQVGVPQDADDRAFRADLVDAMLLWSGRDRPDVDECARELAAVLDKHPMVPAAPQAVFGISPEALTRIVADNRAALGLPPQEPLARTTDDGRTVVLLADEIAAAKAEQAASEYPRTDGDFTIIGPDCFAMADGSVLSWRGINYVPQELLDQATTRLHDSHLPTEQAAADELRERGQLGAL